MTEIDLNTMMGRHGIPERTRCAFYGNSYIGNRGPGLVVTHRGQVGNCNALVGNLFCDNATDIAELGKDNCHVHFNSQLNCTFLSNTFLGGTQNPAYAITHEYTWRTFAPTIPWTVP